MSAKKKKCRSEHINGKIKKSFGLISTRRKIHFTNGYINLFVSNVNDKLIRINEICRFEIVIFIN